MNERGNATVPNKGFPLKVQVICIWALSICISVMGVVGFRRVRLWTLILMLEPFRVASVLQLPQFRAICSRGILTETQEFYILHPNGFSLSEI